MATPLSAPLAAQIVQGIPERALRGKGTVEARVDKNTYVLKFDASRITVKVADGELDVGADVFVTRAGERVTIRQIPPAQTPRPAGSAATTVDISPAPAPSAARTVPSGTAVPLKAGAPSGLYAFETPQKAAEWLSTRATNENAVRQAAARQTPDRPVVIRVTPDAGGSPQAVILQDEKARAEIQTILNAQLRSPAWKAISPDLFLAQLGRQGSVSIERLETIDRALTSVPSAGGAAARPAAQTEIVYRQWLSLALDPNVDPATVARRLPVETAADVVMQLHRMAILTEDAPALEEAVLTRGGDRGAALVKTFESLGMNLEALLAGDSADDAALQSSKAQLYRALAAANTLSGSVQNPQIQASGHLPVLQDIFSAMEAPVERLAGIITSRTTAVASDLPARLGQFGESVRDRITQSLFQNNTRGAAQPASIEAIRQMLTGVAKEAEQLAGNAVSTVTALQRVLADAIETGGSDLRNVVRQAGQPGGQPPVVTQFISALEPALAATAGTPENKAANQQQPVSQPVRDLALHVSNTFRPADAASPSPLLSRFDETARQAGSILERLAADIRSAVTETMDRIKALSVRDTAAAGAADRDITGALSRLSRQVQDSLQSAARQLQQLLGATATELEGAASRTAQETHRLIQRIAADIDARLSPAQAPVPPGAGERAPDQPVPAGLRQQAEQALARFESLQLLARPAPTPEGSQQILALPMRIGGELTEVRIRLVRKDAPEGRKNKSRKHFSVAINVAPSASGEIAIAMDYTVKNPLAVRLSFEKTQTRAWFEEERTALSKALAGLGFPGVTLAMESARPARGETAVPAAGADAPAPGDSQIDIRA